MMTLGETPNSQYEASDGTLDTQLASGVLDLAPLQAAECCANSMVNSILPTTIEGTGVFAKEVEPEFGDFIKDFQPMQHMGTVEDVADAAEYLASDLSRFVIGQHLLVSGGAQA